MEGIVASSDYKLDKKGRRYPAHRKMVEDTNPYADVMEALGYETENKKRLKQITKISQNAQPSNTDPHKLGNTEDQKAVVEGSIVGGVWTADPPKKGMPDVPAPSALDEPPGGFKDKTKKPMKKPVKEDIEELGELKRSTLRSYLQKAVPSHGDAEFVSRAARDPEEKASAKRTADNRAVGIVRAHKGLKSAHVATMKKPMKEDIEQIDEYGDTARGQKMLTKVQKRAVDRVVSKKADTDPKYAKKNSDTAKRAWERFDMKEDIELDEARGRPAGAATLAKRAAAAAKPREDDDEGEHYDADSGVEADQHIHVQLKKAADSDEKPFEVSFRNGKKHSVSQKVAKTLLSATERLKPEHRKNVHDEIHKSYDSLLAVHKMVAG